MELSCTSLLNCEHILAMSEHWSIARMQRSNFWGTMFSHILFNSLSYTSVCGFEGCCLPRLYGLDGKCLNSGVTILQLGRLMSCVLCTSFLVMVWMHIYVCSCKMMQVTFHLYFIGMKSTRAKQAGTVLW